MYNYYHHIYNLALSLVIVFPMHFLSIHYNIFSNIEYDADDSDCIPDTCGTASSTCSATSFGRR